jgi:sodium/pantothenate symporter
MITVVVLAFAVSLLLYMGIGLYHARRTKQLVDLLPVHELGHAEVKSTGEFDASTTATSISLATVVLFFYEAAPGMGLWLLWCAFTTVFGILVMRRYSKKIWTKVTTSTHRPSIHEFLGTAFNSRALAIVGALCTCIGYLGTFGLELYIGSLFFSSIVPNVNEWVVVLVISIVGFAYTAIGGFRTVIVTDRLQMKMIWVFIIGILLYLLMHVSSATLAHIPTAVYDMSLRPGVGPFIAGILIINSAMFLVSMGVWQRIAASKDERVVVRGLGRSALQTGATWCLIILGACLVYLVITPNSTENPLSTLVKHIMVEGGWVNGVLVFGIILGLFGSQLSTASTNLVATGQTLYSDLFARDRRTSISDTDGQSRELRLSRWLLITAAVLAIGVVAVLSASGFTILDLAFALYGSQLSLFAPVVLALEYKGAIPARVSKAASIGVVLGILMGWAAAGFGKILGIQDLVFLSPIVSLVVSGIVIGIALGLQPKRASLA